ncbi:hypothetical protein GCM10027098_23340 [Bowmanella dokdonensis]
MLYDMLVLITSEGTAKAKIMDCFQKRRLPASIAAKQQIQAGSGSDIDIGQISELPYLDSVQFHYWLTAGMESLITTSLA